MYLHLHTKINIPRIPKGRKDLRSMDRAANNFSFLKGHISDQVSILVGQIEMWSDVSFFNYYF